MTLEATLLIAAAIFSVGLYGAISQQVVVMVMMGLELMINAVILAVVPVVLIAGAIYAVVLRSRRPEVFARIGGADPERVQAETVGAR